MKAIKHIGIFLVAALLAVSCGVSKVKDISLSSVGIAYVVPTSMRSMDAKLLLGINNPAMSFAVQEITGTIRYEEKPIAHFSTGSIELEGKTDKVYELPCTVTLAEDASLLDVLVIASKRSLNGLKADVDIQAALKKNGIVRAPYKFRDLDISSFSRK
ncbi:MAG: hypothetical protein IJT74_03340 [Bacteroidales bacterium]|nr:hypothetical protein [Bacteroidales bacterium]